MTDMSAHGKDVHLTTYADDHQMYVKGRDHEPVKWKMKTQDQQILSWYSHKFLKAIQTSFNL